MLKLLYDYFDLSRLMKTSTMVIFHRSVETPVPISFLWCFDLSCITLEWSLWNGLLYLFLEVVAYLYVWKLSLKCFHIFKSEYQHRLSLNSLLKLWSTWRQHPYTRTIDGPMLDNRKQNIQIISTVIQYLTNSLSLCSVRITPFREFGTKIYYYETV